MEIKTKFGPAAVLMDTTGTKIGIVKKITTTIHEGNAEATVAYYVVGNGQTMIIDEKEAIGLMPMGTKIPEKS